MVYEISQRMKCAISQHTRTLAVVMVLLGFSSTWVPSTIHIYHICHISYFVFRLLSYLSVLTCVAQGLVVHDYSIRSSARACEKSGDGIDI